MATKTPSLPTPPKFDGSAALALYDANLDTLLAVQKVILDLTRTFASRQFALVSEVQGKVEAAFKGGIDTKKQPLAYADDAKAAIEKVVAEAKENVELGLKAQGEVTELLTKRVQANFDHVKSLAA